MILEERAAKALTWLRTVTIPDGLAIGQGERVANGQEYAATLAARLQNGNGAPLAAALHSAGKLFNALKAAKATA